MIQTLTTGAATGTSFSPTVVCQGSNTDLLVLFSLNDNVFSSITYAGTPLTLIANVTNGVVNTYAFHMVAPPTGSHSLVIALTNNRAIVFGAYCLSSINQSNPIDTFNTSVTPSVSVTTTVPNTTVFDVLGADTSTTPGVGAGQVEQWNLLSSSSNRGCGSYESAPTAGSVTMDWSTGATSAMIAVAMVSTPEVQPQVLII